MALPEKRAPRRGVRKPKRPSGWRVDFRDRLRELLGDRSNRDIAKRLEVHSARISEWRSGLQLPAAENLRRISETFSVSVDWLLGLTTEPKFLHQSRETAPLEADIAAEVLRRLEEKRSWQVDGHALLDEMVRLARQDVGEWRRREAEGDRLAYGAQDILEHLEMIEPHLPAKSPKLARSLIVQGELAADLRKLARQRADQPKFVRRLVTGRLRVRPEVAEPAEAVRIAQEMARGQDVE